MAITLMAAVAALWAMGDGWGDAVLRRWRLACGVLWMLDLVCLVLVQTINGLGVTRRDDGQADR